MIGKWKRKIIILAAAAGLALTPAAEAVAETEKSEAFFDGESESFGFADEETTEAGYFADGETTEAGYFADGETAEESECFADEEAIEAEYFADEKMTGAELAETPAPDVREAILDVQEGEDITEPLNRLLYIMGQQATDEMPCTVTVPAGSYQLTGTICMYSNLKLAADGAVITKTSPTKHILLRLGNSPESIGGCEGYRNVTIQGGTWNLNYQGIADKAGGTGYVGFRIGHASHVKIENVTFLNNLKSHFLELAGVRDVQVTGCTFRGYWEGYEGGGQECIQLDACLEGVFPGYEPCDGAACQDVVITGNRFEDVFAGVGSHSMVFDRPYQNITISGNTFRNIKKRGVWCLNYVNSRVENNQMENVGGGVFVNSLYLPNTHVLPGQKVTDKNNQYSAGVTVAGNQISVSAVNRINGAAWNGYGIQLYGTKVKKNSQGVPKGTYAVKGVTVSGNRVTGYGNGIKLLLAENCQVSGNTVENNRGVGITFSESDKCKATYNNVRKCSADGIYASKADNLLLYGNEISANAGSGIRLQSLANGRISKNTVNDNRKYGILASGAGMKTFKSNKLQGNRSAYAIRAYGSRGIANLKKLQSGKVTYKTRTLTGKAYGGKRVSVYAKKGSGAILVGKGYVNAKGRYSIRVKKQKRGTVLNLISRDRYGNSAVTSYKVK